MKIIKITTFIISIQIRVLLSPDQTRQNKHLPAFCIRVADSPPDRSTGQAGKCEIKEQTNKLNQTSVFNLYLKDSERKNNG